jgi:hypothetical protein
MGNIIELCAANQYPDPKTYLGRHTFYFCYSDSFVILAQQLITLPSQALQCALLEIINPSHSAV